MRVVSLGFLRQYVMLDVFSGDKAVIDTRSALVGSLSNVLITPQMDQIVRIELTNVAALGKTVCVRIKNRSALKLHTHSRAHVHTCTETHSQKHAHAPIVYECPSEQAYRCHHLHEIKKEDMRMLIHIWIMV